MTGSPYHDTFAPVRDDSASGSNAWTRLDVIILSGLVISAAITRFWHLDQPTTTFFDEITYVGGAHAYLRGEQFFDSHPPFAKYLIALSIWLFGDNPWSWRFPNASIGTALIGITYLLGRRVFISRLAATLAASFVLLDGVFLVDSRAAVLDIVYVSLAALSYLLLFSCLQSANARAKRFTLVFIGVTLGLCFGAKLYVPGITCLLVTGFLIYVLIFHTGLFVTKVNPSRCRLIAGALLLLGSVSALTYLVLYLPYYLLGWWSGFGALVEYYREVAWFEGVLRYSVDVRASPWWSWPLMLHPFAYRLHEVGNGKVASIWFGANPVLCWEALAGLLLISARLLRRAQLMSAFLVIGYLAYLLMLVPVGRALYVYMYMPSLYLGYVALASLVADCWNERATTSEQAVLMLGLVPSFLLGLGIVVGTVCFLGLFAGFATVLRYYKSAGKVVFVSFLLSVLVAFVYFSPVWAGVPVTRAGWQARMWLRGPGICDWSTSTNLN